VFRLLWSPADDDDKSVIIEATEAISKSFRSNTPGKHEIKELQKQPNWSLHTYCRKC
jgi:hypothetical protein